MSRAAVANAWLEGYQQPSERAIEFARLYIEEGLSMQEIADKHNLSRERVRQLLKPFGVNTHAQAERRRKRREEVLRESYARIMADEATTAEESERLGYAKPDYLRMAFWRLGLYLQKPAMSPERRRELARERRLEQIKRGPKKHGTVSAYKNFACRCPRCKSANSKWERDARRRRRAARAEEAEK